MDGLRMVDEWRTLRRGDAGPDAVFAPSGRFEEYREPGARRVAARSSPRPSALFLLLDGRQPGAPRDRPLAPRQLRGRALAHALRRAGLIEPSTRARCAKKQRRRRQPLELARGAVAARRRCRAAALAAARGASCSAWPRAARRAPAPAAGLARRRFLRRGARRDRDAAAAQSRRGLPLRARRVARGLAELRAFYREARRAEPLAPLDPRDTMSRSAATASCVLAPED